MSRTTPVAEVMTTGVRMVGVDEKLSVVRRVLSAGDFHHIPVVDGKHLVGIVSSRDLIRLYRESERRGADGLDDVLDASGRVRDVMSTQLVTLRIDESVERAIDLIADGHIHAVLVLDANDRLAGIVTDTDLLDYLCE